MPIAAPAAPRRTKPRAIRTGFPSRVRSQVRRSMLRLMTAPRPRTRSPNRRIGFPRFRTSWTRLGESDVGRPPGGRQAPSHIYGVWTSSHKTYL